MSPPAHSGFDQPQLLQMLQHPSWVKPLVHLLQTTWQLILHGVTFLIFPPPPTTTPVTPKEQISPILSWTTFPYIESPIIFIYLRCPFWLKKFSFPSIQDFLGGFFWNVLEMVEREYICIQQGVLEGCVGGKGSRSMSWLIVGVQML